MLAKNLSEWRKLVLERDNYICQIDGEPAKIADHILAKNLDKTLLLDIDNGRALCHSCHAKYGTKVYYLNHTNSITKISTDKLPWFGRKRVIGIGRSFYISIPKCWLEKWSLHAGDWITCCHNSRELWYVPAE